MNRLHILLMLLVFSFSVSAKEYQVAKTGLDE